MTTFIFTGKTQQTKKSNVKSLPFIATTGRPFFQWEKPMSMNYTKTFIRYGCNKSFTARAEVTRHSILLGRGTI